MSKLSTISLLLSIENADVVYITYRKRAAVLFLFRNCCRPTVVTLKMVQATQRRERVGLKHLRSLWVAAADDAKPVHTQNNNEER